MIPSQKQRKTKQKYKIKAVRIFGWLFIVLYDVLYKNTLIIETKQAIVIYTKERFCVAKQTKNQLKILYKLQRKFLKKLANTDKLWYYNEA